MNKNLLALTITASLVGCGGGSGGDNNGGSGDNGGQTLSGKAGSEYYLENALVCLDTNKDEKCDTEEILTGGSGDWKFSNATAARILLRTTLGSTDGFESIPQTTEGGYAVDPVFKLTAPAGYTFVSPISTMVDFRVISGLNKTIEEAELAIASALGINGFLYDISGDYIAGSAGSYSLKGEMNAPSPAEMALIREIAAATTLLLQEASEELEKNNASQEVKDNALAWIMGEVNKNFNEMATAAKNGESSESIANAANIDMTNIIEDIEFSIGGVYLNNDKMNRLLLLETINSEEEDETQLHFLTNEGGHLAFTKDFYEEENLSKEGHGDDAIILVEKQKVYSEANGWQSFEREVEKGQVLTSKISRNKTQTGWAKAHYFSKASDNDRPIDGELLLSLETDSLDLATSTRIKAQDISSYTVSKILSQDTGASDWLASLELSHGNQVFPELSEMYVQDKTVLSEYKVTREGMEYPSQSSINEFALRETYTEGGSGGSNGTPPTVKSDLWTETTSTDEFGNPVTTRTYHDLHTLEMMEVFSSRGANIYVQLVGTNASYTSGYVNFLKFEDNEWTYVEQSGNWSVTKNCSGCSSNQGVEMVNIDIPNEYKTYLTSYDNDAKTDQIFIAEGAYDNNGMLVWGVTLNKDIVLSKGKVGYNQVAIDFLKGLASQ